MTATVVTPSAESVWVGLRLKSSVISMGPICSDSRQRKNHKILSIICRASHGEGILRKNAISSVIHAFMYPCRSRYEYWLGGNDIDEENTWVWSGSGNRIGGRSFSPNILVPSWGWIDDPLPSGEENCLTWSITVLSGGQRTSSGWHSDSCCNNIRFICELDS